MQAFDAAFAKALRHEPRRNKNHLGARGFARNLLPALTLRFAFLRPLATHLRNFFG